MTNIMMPQPQQPQQMSLEQVLESIAKYNSYGKALQRATTMAEVGTRLAEIAHYAEHAVMNEADDWFDRHTISRNMKEIKTYTKEFSKLAMEADQIHQRMTALYDDMGRILERYFEIPSEQVPAPDETQNGEPKVPDDASLGDVKKLDEKGALQPDELHMDLVRPVKEAPHDELSNNEERKSKIDKLTLRAILLVYKRLRLKNPEMAKQFAALPPQKIQELIWKLI